MRMRKVTPSIVAKRLTRRPVGRAALDFANEPRRFSAAYCLPRGLRMIHADAIKAIFWLACKLQALHYSITGCNGAIFEGVPGGYVPVKQKHQFLECLSLSVTLIGTS